jgi:hypothetical protein
MTRETRSAGIMGELQRLSVTMEANKDLLPNLEPFRLKLTGIVVQIFEIAKQQAAHKAGKQETAKQLRTLLTQGNRVADLVRTGVRDHFGPEDEKVAEFGVQPFRGLKTKSKTPAPAPESTPTPAPLPITPPAHAGPAVAVKSDQ